MVKITPVSVTDEQTTDVQYDERDEDYSDISDSGSEVSDFEDDENDIANETLTDRIIALKDIVPPQYRPMFSDAYGKAQGALEWSFKAAWVVTTSVMFLAAPFALVANSNMESSAAQMGMRQMQEANEIIAPGAN
ncbi:mitochondrial outer membrane translocase complex, subunit Tom22 [Lipomyces tetrasporus]|uniref:Mitochondrial outer membrane translocase complex, subunit Tom22 n=1 Tax=Lipomyces tetrasporus TaxID=54092 RepID=A0AAD7QMH9_9ASCO|nr:mitochondrial outer membrane translocase complex, subunit Tom22 [Lipomyces tetrasporus]KAJ8097788.1 mitochondrial outer membrane translocase complex, subunit Tom22 [Lipomyces tetrasporus]